jgi:hypothetical protein
MMSQGDAQAPPPAPFKPRSFKSTYRLQGTIAAVVLMWLDFAYIYHGLITSDPGAVAAGMLVMLGAAAMAYYFG